MRAVRAIAFFVSGALAICSGGQFNPVPSFTGTTGCVPGGYTQAQDLGYCTQDSLISSCAAICSSNSNCQAFVGSLQKAGDSGLYTGQCFYYPVAPTGPQPCVDHPTIILAQAKDNTLQCFSNSASAATGFCSNLLSVGTVTVYTSTFTPVAFTTSSKTVSTSTTSTLKTTVTLSTTVVKTLTSPSTSFFSATSTITSFTTTLVTTSTTTTTTTYSTAQVLEKRIAGFAAPACLNNNVPISRLSSACSCLNVLPATVSLISTAPTLTVASTSTKRSTLKFSTTSSSTKVSTTSTTTTAYSEIDVTSTSSTFTTQTLTSTVSTAVSTTSAVVAVPASLYYIQMNYDGGGRMLFQVLNEGSYSNVEFTSLVYEDYASLFQLSNSGHLLYNGNVLYVDTTDASSRVRANPASALVAAHDTPLTCQVDDSLTITCDSPSGSNFYNCKVPYSGGTLDSLVISSETSAENVGGGNTNCVSLISIQFVPGPAAAAAVPNSN